MQNGIMQKLDIRASDAALSESNQSLSGLTFAVKDMIAVAGYSCAFGCPDWLRTHQVNQISAPVVQTLLNSGAHLVANAVCDELAFSLDGINSHYGTPLNPQAPECIPGGSSSGSASLVAQGLVDFALGTDTAGSTRVPASYCGIWGLRPSHGAISTQGVLPLGPSFDTVGLLTKSLPVLERLASILIGEQKQMPATKLIILTECFEILKETPPPMMAAVQRLSEHFATVNKQALVSALTDNADGLQLMVDHFGIIRGFEAWQSHGQWYEQFKPALGAGTRQRLLACKDINAEQKAKSLAVRQQMQEKFGEFLQGTILCLPTTAGIAPLKALPAAELEQNRAKNLRLNAIASFLGLPQLNIPLVGLGTEPALLVPGLSIIGGVGSENELLRLAGKLKL